MNKQAANYTYKEFIEEIRETISEGQRSDFKSLNHNDAKFKAWRHKLKDSINDIEAMGYEINCTISRRVFFSMSYTSSSSDNRRAYESDLIDTINELTLILQKYEKYGEPKIDKVIDQKINNNSATDTIASTAKKTEVVSLKWLWENIPIKGWSTIILILLGAFSLGMEFQNYGGWKIFHKIYELIIEK
jgi:hypothetical protein